MQPNRFYMRNRLQASEQVFKHGVFQAERIAAAEDDFMQGMIARAKFQRVFKAMFIDVAICIGEVFSKTITAVNRAGMAGNQQRTMCVFFYYAWLRSGFNVTDRIA